jgi:undecaprenyl-diphosphatase
MSWLEAVLLGIIQGVTEFVPISSDGHLAIASGFFDNLSDGKEVHWYITMLHAGSIAAIVVFFARDLVKLLTVRRTELLWIIVGTIPVGIIGLLAEERIEQLTAFWSVACLFLIINGAVLMRAHFYPPGELEVGKAEGVKILMIAIAQILALLPGLSRSGMTITAGLRGGLRPDEAFRFSFLLGLPAITGAVVLKVWNHVQAPAFQVAWGPLGLGLVVTFLFSLLALYFLSHMIRRRSLLPFAFYCIFVGALGLLYYFALRPLIGL